MVLEKDDDFGALDEMSISGNQLGPGPMMGCTIQMPALTSARSTPNASRKTGWTASPSTPGVRQRNTSGNGPSSFRLARYGIPCVGFGPGAESQAHAPNEVTWKQDLVNCAALYAAVPALYKPENKAAVTQFRQELTGNVIK